MKKMQSEITHVSKQRGYRFWIGFFTIIVGVPLLLYYGYCWGLWGRSSLLLQYLFQCNCPAASEEARYPEQVDVIIPACRYLNITLLPGDATYMGLKEGLGLHQPIYWTCKRRRNPQ